MKKKNKKYKKIKQIILMMQLNKTKLVSKKIANEVFEKFFLSNKYFIYEGIKDKELHKELEDDTKNFDDVVIIVYVILYNIKYL